MAKKLGFVIKRKLSGASIDDAAALALELAAFALSRGSHLYFAPESQKTARKLKSGKVHIVNKETLSEHCDLIVVLGGDGTLLSIARLMKRKSVPVMGVNMGQLGFLTEIKKSEALPFLTAILDGKKIEVSERALLEVSVKRKGKMIFQGPVVNDAVISKGAIARIVNLGISVNGHWVHDVRADGIIVSTPTGSTAYSLAAGGPIVEPTLKALVLSPICPHSLTQRPLVISDQEEIQICLLDKPGQVLLTLDGQDAVTLRENDTVTVRRLGRHSLQIVSSPTRDYFSLLREKLKFGMRS